MISAFAASSPLSSSSRIAAPLLESDAITVRYGRSIACEAVSFSVAPGEVYALLGRNGAGKSSLVRCLLGQQNPSAGRARLFGGDSWTTRVRALERVGVVPEEPDAPPEMTALRLADFCRRLYPRWDGASVTRRLDRFEVPRDVPFGRLSKGQKCQVLLAMALAPSPDLLVLDDPTLGLDVVAREFFWEEFLGDLADRGTTALVTTHDLAAIEGIATRVGVLKMGRLIVDEDVETLKGRFRRIRYANRMTETRTEFGNELDAFDAVRVRVRGWGIDAVVSNWDESVFERFRLMDGVEGAEATALSIEEIFVALAGEADGNGGRT
ncbi:MAG: ABC transporter ATP-binding protein [Acidobacteriota bacterium]